MADGKPKPKPAPEKPYDPAKKFTTKKGDIVITKRPGEGKADG